MDINLIILLSTLITRMTIFVKIHIIKYSYHFMLKLFNID